MKKRRAPDAKCRVRRYRTKPVHDAVNSARWRADRLRQPGLQLDLQLPRANEQIAAGSHQRRNEDCGCENEQHRNGPDLSGNIRLSGV